MVQKFAIITFCDVLSYMVLIKKFRSISISRRLFHFCRYREMSRSCSVITQVKKQSYDMYRVYSWERTCLLPKRMKCAKACAIRCC